MIQTAHIARFAKPIYQMNHGFQPSNYTLGDNINRKVVLQTNKAELFFIEGIPAPDASTANKMTRFQTPLFSSDTTSKEQRVISQRLLDQVISEANRQREIRRLRYRKKLEKYTESCELENIQMRLEIGSLEQHRRYLMTTHDNIWYVGTEYFRLFQYGYLKPIVSNASRTTPSSLSQQDFVSKVIVSDVAFNARCGRERMMKQWKLLSQWFVGIEFNLVELKSISAGSLVAATTTSVTFTERTMHIVFPRLISGKRRMLGEKLLNRRIVMHGSVRLAWSTTNCQIIGLFAESDMLTPVLRLLGNLQDTSYVFEKAPISPSFW